MTSGMRYGLADHLVIAKGSQPQHTSGVEEYEVGPLLKIESDLLLANPYPDRSNPPEYERFSELLLSMLDAADSADKLPVMIWLDEQPLESIAQRLERRIGMGHITTLFHYNEYRIGYIYQDAINLSQDLADASTIVEASGGEVLSTCGNFACLSALLTPGEFAQVKNNPAFARFDPVIIGHPEHNTEKSPSNDQDYGGSFTRLGHQLEQYYSLGFDGGGDRNEEASRIAVMEVGPPDTSHYGFFDANLLSRVIDVFGCHYSFGTGGGASILFSDCQWDAPAGFGDPSTGDDHQLANHATSMMGLVAGDVTNGQDPNITSSQEQFSGYAPGALLYSFYDDIQKLIRYYGFDLNEGLEPEEWEVVIAAMQPSIEQMYASLIGLYRPPEIANIAIGDEQLYDPNCLGQDVWSRLTNRLFESGTLPIVAAGNQNTPTNIDDCRITAPGSAVGAFTVAAHGTYLNQNQTIERFNGYLNGQSSPGGFSREQGGFRSIVDMSAQDMEINNYIFNKGYGSVVSRGTSNAASVVSGAAAVHVDAYRRNIGRLVDDPGILFANLLLMGDRTLEALGPFADSRQTTGYNNLWGAGRLKMRMFNHEGMDAPAELVVGRVCVGHEEVVRIPINRAGPIPEDADVLKIVTFHYDRRREEGAFGNGLHIFARSESTNMSGVPNLWSEDTNGIENKHRIFVDNLSAFAEDYLHLGIYGFDVSGTHPTCGVNRTMVYYSFFYEDSSRDDPEGPGPLIQKEDLF